MCETLFHEFRNFSLARNYRYRSDGYQIEYTQANYRLLLEKVRALIFSGDDDSMAVLLIPNSLDRPLSLSILAHSGYDDDLAPRAKLDLSGEGQGLSGRAYNLREPFFSLNADSDPRVEYAMEEHSRSALAVPFVTSWGLPPFGVLYLASKSSPSSLDSQSAYLALILGNILSEQLGRWWLTRLRRAHDLLLHRNMDDMVDWLESLDQHGPNFQQALDRLMAIWAQIDARAPNQRDGFLALIVFDIDQYRQNVQQRGNEPVPLKAQLHVRRAIQKILPNAPEYWFKNDHVCLILEGHDAENARSLARRIANQVQTLPPDILDENDRKITISVSAAIKVMSYDDLHDLEQAADERLRRHLQNILDDLHEQTRHAAVNSMQIFTPEGWRKS